MTRRFNPQEDQLIIEQSEGKHSIIKLMKTLHTSREAIARRATQLGVEVCVQRRHRYSRRREQYAREDELFRRKESEAQEHGLVDHGNPVKVEHRGHEDALLESLFLFHGNRRY